MNGIRIPDIVVTSVCACLAMGQGRPAVDPQIGVRDGFELTIAVADIPRARFMAFGPDGTLFVSLPDAGQIKACRDESGEGPSDRPGVILARWLAVVLGERGNQFPAEYRGDAFVAYHGSWNRQKKAGYCVTRVRFDHGRPYGELIYVNFLTSEGKVLGRPVDVVVVPDGSLLISDDEGGRVYRLTYT